jgi:hypothetical protein
MDEITKRLTYALHDTYGYHEDEEKNAENIRRLLHRNHVMLITNEEFDRLYEKATLGMGYSVDG